MRKFIRAGRGLPLPKVFLLWLFRSFAYFKKYLALSVLTVSTYYLACVIMFLPAFGQESEHKLDVKPLQIGDTIPEELWEMHFPVINGTNDQIQYLNLGEFRDKVIVLDFWATWCGSCLSAMPHLAKLQKEFEGDLFIIPITYEKADKVQGFLRNSTSSIINSFKEDFFSIVDDRYLRSHFEFKSIPQIVVITNGKVKTLTMPSMLNEENVAAMIKGEEAYIAKKRFGMLEKPLLKLAFEDVRTQKPLYYSAITGYMDGVINAARHEMDSVNSVQRYYQTSLSVTNLYSVTGLFDGHAVNSKRRILEINEPYRYTNFKKEDGFYVTSDPSWKEENAYNYEIIVPLYLSIKDINYKFKADLDLYFGLNTRIEKRLIPVLLLKESKKSNKTKSLSKTMIYSLNTIPTIPLVINEAKLLGDETFDVSSSKISIDILRNILKEYGLELIEEEREMEMFVLTERGFQKPTSKLEISRYGYIYPNK